MINYQSSYGSFRLFHRHTGVSTFVVMLLMVLCVGRLDAAWLLKRSVDGPKEQALCHLESDAKTVDDGYDATRARLIVSTDSVQIVSEAPLDAEFSDIGLRVDHRPFVKMDDVMGRKQARFATAYTDLIGGFKKGQRVRAQLRFWPTWPATGTHSVAFSLRGFSKAYAMMQRCEP
jgi:hypothetical protein